MNRISDPYYAGGAKRKANPSKMLSLRRKPEIINCLLIRRVNNTNFILAKAGIQRRSKHANVGLAWIPDQARNDEIHGIFSRDQ